MLIQVLDAGQICEFASPHLLLQIPDGHFNKMALQTGTSEYQQLVSIAEEAYRKKKSTQPEAVDLVTQGLVVKDTDHVISV